jgi:hypothetical protein
MIESEKYFLRVLSSRPLPLVKMVALGQNESGR